MTVSGYAKDDVLVSADWAKAHLDDPSIRFVEVDVDTTAYDQSHIPGAVGWNWTSQLSDGVRRDIATREDFSELLSQSGIGARHARSCCTATTTTGSPPGRTGSCCCTGTDNVRLLNGGRKFWLDNNLPLSTDVPSYPATGYQLPEADFSLRAFRDDILPRVGDASLRWWTCAARPSSTARSSPRPA